MAKVVLASLCRTRCQIVRRQRNSYNVFLLKFRELHFLLKMIKLLEKEIFSLVVNLHRK